MGGTKLSIIEFYLFRSQNYLCSLDDYYYFTIHDVINHLSALSPNTLITGCFKILVKIIDIPLK